MGAAENATADRGPVVAGVIVSVGSATLVALIASGIVSPFSIFSLEIAVMLAVIGWLGGVRNV
ncbi:hypothetical protein Huta_0364 [Halorhabdus utahensis DSM 12940]|uniref:Uncharacterized protein n=1 Tax=Halorhabdus utahensis (strain DSM 12940 / JCM 11049 / AX-2) TaxID=519442 RepID=C7NRB4_HALUD|nr:hypothetical protein [Halorhabdus utahensis]ACV10551.1 hypothetical protein Huta_0364 [Halorhabdus utahensis DSM 12940]